MIRYAKSVLVVLLGGALLGAPGFVHAMTAHEILEEIAKRNLADSFRVFLRITTLKGKKTISKHRIWLMGKKMNGEGAFFLDFEAPEESKGLRILFRVAKDKRPAAYMFLPATGRTLPLAADNESANIGETGLTMTDFLTFMPQAGESQTIAREEMNDGKDCYVIKITPPGDKGHRLVWVTKNDFLILKSQTIDAKGKVQRTFRVVEFFRNEKGREFPREEEIVIVDKKTRIRLRQENALFGIEISDEILDPKTFGKYKWRL